MADYDDTNTGVLFNVDEVQSERHPNMTGKLNVEGKEYRIAAWEKLSRSGKEFLSLAISEPREENAGYEKARAQADDLRVKDEVDEPINLDDIPF